MRSTPPSVHERLSPEATEPDAPRRVQILLVEDDPDYVLVLRHLLDRTRLQYAVSMAYRISEIGQRPLPVKPQVALVDQNLPDGTAADAIARIEATWPGVPVLVLTAHGDQRQAVELMKRGAYDYLLKGDVDAGRLTVALEHALAHGRLEADLAQAQAQLRAWAIRDELTGLYNRRHVRARLDEELARAARHGHPLTVLMADLDHFKTLNDTFGHPLGDEALRVTARVLQAESRTGDVVARYGGEEFLVVLPQTPGAGGEQTAERIRAALAAAPVRWGGDQAQLTLSVGVAALEDVATPTADRLLQAADRALYAAKRAGRDRVHRAGRRTGPLGQVAQGSAVRQRLMDALAALIRGAGPALDAQGKRAVRWAEALADAQGLGVGELETLLTAARLSPLCEALPGGGDALQATLTASGVMAQEARLISQAAHGGAAAPLAAQILAVVAAGARHRTPAAAAQALREPAESAYDAALVQALGALGSG